MRRAAACRVVGRLMLAATLAVYLAACGGARAPAGPDTTGAASGFPAEALNLTLAPPQVPGEQPRRPVPRDVLNKTQAEVRALFGEPALLRREAPSEVWQYLADTPSCVMILVLYPVDGQPGQMRVQHARSAARMRGAAVDEADCLAALLKTSPANRPIS